MSDVSDAEYNEFLEDNHVPSDEEDNEMSVDEEDEVSEDEDDEASDDEEDENSEDGDSEDEDDRLPQEKCGLSKDQYAALLRDEHDGLLEESGELQGEEDGAILDGEAAEAAWPTCCAYLNDATTELRGSQKIWTALHSSAYHSPTGHATKADIDAFHEAKCDRIRYAYRRSILQHMQDFWPRELRDMVYEYLFEDVYENLAARKYKVGNLAPFRRDLGVNFRLFAADTQIKQELAKAWYEATRFSTEDASTIDSCLSQLEWSAALVGKPLDLVLNVEIYIPVLYARDTAEEILDLQRLGSLFQLKERSTITITLEGHNNESRSLDVIRTDAEDYAQKVEWLFWPLACLRRAGYKVIVAPMWNRTVVFGPEDLTLERVTTIIQAAFLEWDP
ncbi:uncharacterized protein J4E79_011255 [Alternaria viburni]|uniref:uncharacterized protein n=1 Tax=Alternaria viburni TaxID=566460 RepID=UPI0020C2501D|nr:uncharacterized protein J4E79_011255 [Alternaria viburni]KAI4643315.1 hypothetical protein J4E79_011255 [Alternaria viburni]